jgi:hypothetical protein
LTFLLNNCSPLALLTAAFVGARLVEAADGKPNCGPRATKGRKIIHAVVESMVK